MCLMTAIPLKSFLQSAEVSARAEKVLKQLWRIGIKRLIIGRSTMVTEKSANEKESKGKYYDYLTSFHKISRALGSTLKSAELFDILLKSITETMKAKASSLMLIDEKSNELKHIHSHGLSENYLSKGPIDLDRSILDRVECRASLISDAATDERVQYKEEAKREGIASILVVPIVVNGKVIGCIQLYTSTPCDFSEDETNFVFSLAEMGGLALENARLYEQRKENNRVFWELAKSINSSLKLNEVLEAMVKNITRTLDLKGCVIRLLDEKRRVLELMASFGLSEKYIKKGTVDLDKSSIEPMEGKVAYVADASTDSRMQYPEEAKQEGIASILSVPMKVKDKVVGVMRIYTHKQREFGDDEMPFILALADLGGLAVENAVMFQKIKDDYDDLRDNLWSYRSWF
jgi:signal transduction protein with GAF and PtsI domain